LCVTPLVKSSDVVEAVTSETETWLKFRDRDLEVRDSRPHISLMVIKANSLNNAATKYLAYWQISRQ